MKVSVIVPVYNVQEYLGKCVKSIQKQTLRDIEIILVDDGSTDLSGFLCDCYRKYDNRIRVIHKQNGGLSDARNAGIDVAKGDFLFFVDSDDWIDEDTLEILYDIAIDEEAEIVECSYRNVFMDHIEEETANTGEMIIGDSVFAIRSQIFWRYFKSVAWNKLYSRKIFSDGKRYPKGRYHEDEFFSHEAFGAANKLVYIDVSKYNYVRERKGSITDKITSKILDVCYALRQRINFVQKNNLIDVLIDVQNAYMWVLFDRLEKCSDAGINDEKLQQLLADLKEDEQEVMKWKIANEYKYRYAILCQSYELFEKCIKDKNLFTQVSRKMTL